MAVTINASTSAGLVQTADTSGVLQLQTNSGTTALTIDTSQRAAFVAGTAALPAITTTGDTNTGMFFPAADTIAFAEGGAEVMRIDSSGKVGIGTASPTETLSLMTASGTTSIRLSTNNNQNANVSLGNTATNFTIGTNFGGTGTKITMNLQCPDNSLTIDGDGYLIVPKAYSATTGSAANLHVLSSGVFVRSTSSIKYKTDVQDAVHGLDKVMELRPVTYKGINDGDIVFGGLIAEEVHEAGLTEFVQYAEDGTPDALAYGNMVSLLTKAIQEQQTIINDLKARIETLEGAA
jgi:hypothetical protein